MRASTPATTAAATPRPTPAAPAAQGQGTERTAPAGLSDTRTPETTRVLAGGRRRGEAPSHMAEDEPGPRTILHILNPCYVLFYHFNCLANLCHFISVLQKTPGKLGSHDY